MKELKENKLVNNTLIRQLANSQYNTNEDDSIDEFEECKKII